MCVFDHGESISNAEDVRNLVNSVIFRQTAPYTKQSIIDQVHAYLDGSPVNISSRALDDLVTDTLRILLLNGNMTLHNGCYSPRAILAVA